jgi:hypothetical protein
MHPGMVMALKNIDTESLVPESQTAKTGIMQTDVYGSRAYHARCLEPGCDWESRRYDRIQQAQAAAKKHAATHFNKKGVAEGLDHTEKISGLVDIPAFTPSGVAKVVNTGDRIMAVMNVKGVNIPLYISTGQGGKASVATGKWYPVFGVDPSTGWLNKGGEASINKFYGSKILALAAARLNNTLGDLSNVEDKLPAMKRSGQSVINKDLQPMGYSEAAANPDEFKKRVNSFLAKLGEGPFYPVDNPKEQSVAENFADGRKPGRKGLAKRMGVNTKASVSSLRKTAKNSSGEKQRMAHWLANMKAGRKK